MNKNKNKRQDHTFQIGQMECKVKSITNDYEGRNSHDEQWTINKVDFMIMDIRASNMMSSKYLNQQLWRKLDKSKIQLANWWEKKESLKTPHVSRN